MIIESLLGALVPIGAEAVKQLVVKFTGGVKPATIEEQIKLDNLEIERMKALDRKSTRLNSSHTDISRMPSSA